MDLLADIRDSLPWLELTTICLAAVGCVAGWLDCVDKRRKGLRRVRPSGWLIAVVLLSLTVAHVYLQRREQLAGFPTTALARSTFDEVLEVIENADSQIYISTPFVAYADFSNPEFFEKYKTMLLQQANRPRFIITMRVYSPAIRQQRLRDEFADRWAAYEASKKGPVGVRADRQLPETVSRFEQLLVRYSEQRRRPMPTNFDQFVDLLWSGEEAFERELAQVAWLSSEVDTTQPLSLWAADKRRAVVSTAGENATFSTRDPLMARFLITTAETIGQAR